jgi:hypothetical protein
VCIISKAEAKALADEVTAIKLAIEAKGKKP